MQTKISATMVAIDKKINEVKPNTIDELIDTVHSVYGAGNYGTHFSIVKYMGYLQGIRVYVTGRSKSHPLPGKNKVYSVFKGVDKYEAAGWKVEHENN